MPFCLRRWVVTAPAALPHGAEHYRLLCGRVVHSLALVCTPYGKLHEWLGRLAFAAQAFTAVWEGRRKAQDAGWFADTCTAA